MAQLEKEKVDKVEYDGGIHNKLIRLREGIELGVRQQFIEHTQKFETQLKESVQRAEEAAVRRSHEHFTPRVDEMHPKIFMEVAPVQQECKANFRSCQEDTAKLRGEIQKSVDILNSKFINLLADLRRELREELKNGAHEYRAYADSIGSRCDERAAKPQGELSEEFRQFRAEVASGFVSARENTEAKSASILETLNKEAATLTRDLMNLNHECKQDVRDNNVEISACLTAAIADLNTRINGVNHRVDDVSKEGTELRAMLEAKSKQHTIEETALHTKNSKLEERLEEVRVETLREIKAGQAQAAAQLAEKVTGLQEQLTEGHQLMGGEAANLRWELQDRVSKTLREVIDSSAAAATTNAETLGRIQAAESSLDLQRARLESTAVSLSTRCDAVIEEVTSAKACMEKETSSLGSELKTLRTASSSLTHGVLKSLQVVGLLRDEFETPAPQCITDEGQPRNAEVVDLLEWERTGQTLAMRVARNWNQFETAGAPNMLALVGRKADEQDLRKCSQALRLCSPIALPHSMPSAMARENSRSVGAGNSMDDSSCLAGRLSEGLASPTTTLPRPLKAAPAWATTAPTWATVTTPRSNPGPRDGSRGPLREYSNGDSNARRQSNRHTRPLGIGLWPEARLPLSHGTVA